MAQDPSKQKETDRWRKAAEDALQQQRPLPAGLSAGVVGRVRALLGNEVLEV